MVRFGNIYEKIYDMSNLKEAHRNARKDKLFYAEVVMVDSDPDYYLGEIQKMLKNRTYHVGPEDYSVSTINDKGKSRELWKLPYFPHRSSTACSLISPVLHCPTGELKRRKP